MVLAADYSDIVPFSPEYWETWHMLIPAANFTDADLLPLFSLFDQYCHYECTKEGALPEWDDLRPWYFVSIQAATDQAYYPLKDGTGAALLCGTVFRSSSMFVLLKREEFGPKTEGRIYIGADADIDTWITFARRRKLRIC